MTYLSIEVIRKYLKLLETIGKHVQNMPILLTTQAAAAEGGCRLFRLYHRHVLHVFSYGFKQFYVFTYHLYG